MSTTKSVEFRSLPTPEQIRAHFDSTPFIDEPWAEIDAIVAQGTPSAAAAATEPDYRAPTDAELRAHVANGGYWQRGSDGWFYEIWTDSNNRLLGWCHITLPNTRGEGWDANHIYFGVRRKHLRPVDKQGKPIAWESLASTAQPAQPAHADTEWRPLPDTETLKRHPWWVSVGEGLETNYIRTTSEGTYALTEQPGRLVSTKLYSRIVPHLSPGYNLSNPARRWRPCDSAGTPIAWSAIAQPQPRIWSPQGACKITKLECSDGMEPGVVTVDGCVLGTTLGTYTTNVSAFEGDLSQLPPVFDLVVEAPGANPPQIDILVGCRRHGNTLAYIDYIIRNGKTLCSVPRMPVETPTFQRVSGSVLDSFAAAWYNITRNPNETDEQLRQRCRDLWTAKDKPMAQNYTPLSAALPNFATMSPEDRARYRAALDAVDPPTTRDAIRSGLEHAPVEIALDKLHNFVAKLANLWTEGSEEDRQTAARFLRDMVGSDYGKAAIGLAAGAALPHAAPLANKLLPDDKDAAPLLRRIGYILAERGAATGAKQLGLDIMDATGPIVTELRSLLAELLSGMRKAETVAGLLPPASSRLSFDGALTAESAETKR